MIISDFIKELKQKEIEISFTAGKLKYSGPEEYITPELIENLKIFKGKLFKHFWPEEFTNMMPINTEGNKIPLFLVQSDQGNYTISEFFGIDQPIFGFFHPGSNGRKIIYKNIDEMANVYISQVLSIRPSGPYYLIGFSFGGVLAYKMAYELQKLGHNVPYIALIDSRCPLAKEPVRLNNNFFNFIRKDIISPVKNSIYLNLKLLICEIFFLFGKSAPIKLRRLYRWEKYARLARAYKPERINGGILLFKTFDNTSSYQNLGWELLLDKIKLVVLEASHLTVFLTKKSADVLHHELEKYLHEVNNIK